MPLGIFGGSNKDNGPKPQPLTSESLETAIASIGVGVGGGGGGAGSSATSEMMKKDSKGSTVKLNKKAYIMERKLAEGGFAILYLVVDKQGRNYALKRQLIRDDPRQVEASRTESQIVKNLRGHKNIVEYIDHQLTVGKTGVYDYMLLTVFYPDNVLQLLNSRILMNKWLSHTEILDIFCDICEAVARLHHSKTPVIHRDLKVENVLIDRRSTNERPSYILCDFGSATTKVLSKEHFSHAFMEEEIQRYTTLSYRAPEMVDLFSGTAIDTKSDIWALGIMLYKLCYFALPFGESAVAIQSGLFTFPEVPQIADSIKSMINLMLTLSAKHRPNIYQMSHLAFAAANAKCPVFNIEKCARIELNEAVQILHLRDKLGTNYSRLFEKAINDFEAQKRRHTMPTTTSGGGITESSSSNKKEEDGGGGTSTFTSAFTSSNVTANTTTSATTTNSSTAAAEELNLSVEGIIVSTTTTTREEGGVEMMHPRSATTTSVNPRLRPKPHLHSSSTTTPKQQQQPVISLAEAIKREATAAQSAKPLLVTPLKPLQATDHCDAINDELGAASAGTTSACEAVISPRLQHLSAFQPYSLVSQDGKTLQPVEKELHRGVGGTEGNFGGVRNTENFAWTFELSNPFAPQSCCGTLTRSEFNMDDKIFGEHFDAIRRDHRVQGQDADSIASDKLRGAVLPFGGSGGTMEDDSMAASCKTLQEECCPKKMDSITHFFTRVKRDWAAIESRIGDDPFKNAPPLSPHQCLRHH